MAESRGTVSPEQTKDDGNRLLSLAYDSPGVYGESYSKEQTPTQPYTTVTTDLGEVVTHGAHRDLHNHLEQDQSGRTQRTHPGVDSRVGYRFGGSDGSVECLVSRGPGTISFTDTRATWYGEQKRRDEVCCALP
jgi:hypothetical protein